jgi:hypothetical protein
MPDNVKLTGKPMQDRIHDRLRNSGAGAKPDVSVQKGEGPTRTHTNLHYSSSQQGTKRQNREDDGR